MIGRATLVLQRHIWSCHLRYDSDWKLAPGTLPRLSVALVSAPASTRTRTTELLKAAGTGMGEESWFVGTKSLEPGDRRSGERK